MQPIILATANEERRVQVLERMLALGYSPTCCASWPETVAALAQKSSRVLLVDANLPEVSGPFLAQLAQTLPHQPIVQVIEGELAELKPVSNLKRLLNKYGEIELSRFERNLIPICGLGPDALRILNDLAANRRPVLIEGERGTGKEWVARILHRLGSSSEAFVLVRPGEEPVLPSSSAGMIYLEQMHRHSDKAVRATLSIAQANGWRVAAGTYPSVEQPELRHAFIQLDLRPLRERPKSLRPLARLYLESYQKRLGLPKRRITPRLWKKLEAHHWPGNLRELESFIVQAVTSARGPSLSPDHLPRRVLALLDPDHATYAATDAYETIVEERLRDLVSGFKLHPDSPDLYRIVIDSTERALFRLVLNRTAGNQKAAAQLLGLARNTLRTRLQRLDPYLED